MSGRFKALQLESAGKQGGESFQSAPRGGELGRKLVKRGEGAGEVHSSVGVELCRAREAQVVPQRAVPVHDEEVEVHVNAHYGGLSLYISYRGA